jgi:hypothetical protein
MAGADTWSAKEYKHYVYAGDMARGFDVYSFADCTALGCTSSLGVQFGSTRRPPSCSTR